MTYLDGNGSQKKNLDKALFWFIKASEAGNLKAMQLLAEPEIFKKYGYDVNPAVSEYWKTQLVKLAGGEPSLYNFDLEKRQ